MPNTLVHLGAQGLVTRALTRNADFKWIYVGCIIADVPWILQRVAKVAFPDIDLYELRLYAIVQASLLFCLILSAALATLSTRFLKTFVILGFGSILHLSLDACQIKWANGVHFLAPFDWQLTNFSFFWPESFPNYVLTIFGLAYFVFNWQRSASTPFDIYWQSAKRLFVTAVFVSLYFLLPLFFLNSAESANNHFVKTLRFPHERKASYVELDRATYIYRPSGGVLRTFSGEELKMENVELDRSVTISLRGTFSTEDRIHVQEYHVHPKILRDGSSYIGLFLVAILWIWIAWKQKSRRKSKYAGSGTNRRSSVHD